MATFEKVIDFGRLGNQLFQLAATYAHSRNVGENAWLNEKKFNHFSAVFPNFKTFFISSLRRPVKTFNEPSFEFRPLPNEILLNLHGYFQSEKYFKEYETDIKKMFALGIQPKQNICAIHVRRGDYKHYTKTYPLLGLDYYSKSISKIKELNPLVKFKVFSDEIGAAKKLFANYPVEYSVGRSEIQDFKEMISCDYHIIANSSFSWWSSYLSDSKAIIAPSNWFVVGYANPNDLYTDKMIVI